MARSAPVAGQRALDATEHYGRRTARFTVRGPSSSHTRESVGRLARPPKGILAGFGATYEETAPAAFVLNPKADKDSLV